MMRDLGLKVAMPHRTFATVDHIVPTDQVSEPYADPLADAMIKELRKSCADFGITFFDRSTGKQGIVHIVGPERGDHPAPAARSPAATRTPAPTAPSGPSPSGSERPRSATSLRRRPWRSGASRCVASRSTAGSSRASTQKDVILHIILPLGVNGGTGYAYEYAGEVFDRFSMEERSRPSATCRSRAGRGPATSTRTRPPTPTSRAGRLAEGRGMGRGGGALALDGQRPGLRL